MKVSKFGKWVVLSFFLLAAVSVILYAKPEKKNIKVNGAITAITSDSISVGSTTFVTNSKTKYLKTTRDNLEVGYIVDIKGQKDGDAYVARTVKLKDDLSDGGKKGTNIDTGILTDIGAGEGTLLLLTFDDGDQYLVDESVKLKGRNGLSCTAANLVVGLQLRVKYKKPKKDSGEDTIYQLSSVEIIGTQKLKGRIQENTAPSGPLPSITVNGNWIYYDDCTVVIGARQGIDDPSELAVGTRVFVMVNPLDDSTFLGNKVIVNNSDDNAGDKSTESGVVTSVTGEGSATITSFELNGKTFLVDENTEFKVKGYEGEFLQSDFTSDLTVKVTAFTDSEGNLVATKVLIFLPTFNYCGEIQAISATSITMMDIVFEIREGTQFGDETTLADYSVGDFAEIKGIEWPDGTPVAAEISPCEDDDYTVKGEILSNYVDGTTGMLMLNVGGVEVIVTPATEIMFGTESDLTVGTYVQVIGQDYAEGQVLAKRIKIY